MSKKAGYKDTALGFIKEKYGELTNKYSTTWSGVSQEAKGVAEIGAATALEKVAALPGQLNVTAASAATDVGHSQKLAGPLKQAVGAVTGNEDLKHEGKLDMAKAQARDELEQQKAAIRKL